MSKSKTKIKSQQASRNRGGIWPALLFLLGFLLYANSIQNSYALDDDIYTRKNTYINGTEEELKPGVTGFFQRVGHNIPKIFGQGSLMGFNKQNDANYRPIVLLDFLIETAIFGENPYVNHFFNVFFFALCCVILYWFLLRLFRNYNRLLPLLITGLFMLHPIHTDVVANIKSRDEILGFLFGISCLLHVLKYAQENQQRDAFLACFFFCLSILCKENSVTLIVIIPVMVYTFSEFNLPKSLIYIIPFGGLLISYFIVRQHVLSSLTFSDNKIDVVNNSLMAATNAWDMYATNFTMMGRYLWLLIFPASLSWDYSYNTFPIVSWSSFTAFIPGLIYLALIAYAAIRVWKKDVYAFCIIFYLATLILTSNLIIKILATFAERFLFWPSLAFCIALVFLLFRFFKTDIRAVSIELPKNLKYILGAICALYAIKTFSRVPDWKDNTHLFESALESQPNSARVHFAVASEARAQGEVEQNPLVKEQLLNKSLLEYGNGLKIWNKDPEIFFNMGIACAAMGQKDRAIAYYNKALELRPSYGGARNNIGVYYFNEKNYPKALETFQTIVKYDSLYSDAYSNIGACYENTGRHAEALSAFKKAAALNPQGYGVYENMSRTAIAMRDSASARSYAASANLIKEKIAKNNKALSAGVYTMKPVTLLLLLTLTGFIIFVYRSQDIKGLTNRP
jgi:tetratricopeptide (TPR) repeat protein